MTDEDTNSVGWSGSTSCQRDSTDTVRSQNDNNTAAAAAGSVVPIVVLLIIIACVIILLVWYRARKKAKFINVSGFYYKPFKISST